MRAMLIELRPTAITESNLRDLIKQLAEVSSNRTGIKMTVEANGQARLPAAVQVAFYRIAQESLNNIAKHSEATEATIQLNLHPKMSNLLIHDNGRGFDPTQTKANHFGLKIMHERAQEIGAEIEIDSTVGLGTDILMTWRKEDDSSDDY
jgi:signal transduction histidine kinase